MTLLDTIKNSFVGLFRVRTNDWWVEITTVEPRCVYYFGPFQTSTEAKTAHFGYLEDLQDEAAQGITVSIKRCYPTELTTSDENN